MEMKKNIQNQSKRKIEDLVVLLRGAGEMASGVAHRLHRSHFRICLLDIEHPIAVRREVSFCEAIYEGEKEAEGVRAKFISKPEEIHSEWQGGENPTFVCS